MEGKMTLHWEGHFDGAHNLYGYNGKCANLHGHRWNVKADIEIDTIEYKGDGISVDFNVLKRVVDKLDHKYINELPEFKEVSPSAENIVQYIDSELAKAMVGLQGNPRVKRLEVFETPNNSVVIEY